MSTHSSTAASPTVDPERLQMLRELCADADPGLLVEMLGAWKNEAEMRLGAARRALAAADLPAVRAAAHALKGSCSNLGVVRLSELARHLEREAKSVEHATALLGEMDAEFLRAQQTLAVELSMQF